VAAANLNNAHENIVNQMVADNQMAQPGYLGHGDGTPIANICPYDKHGKPLKNVMLFDDQGHPLTDVAPPEVVDSPVMPPVPNTFPLKRKAIDPNTGEVKTVKCPSVIVTPR